MGNESPSHEIKLFTKDMLLVTIVNFLTFTSFQLFPSALPLYAQGLGVADDQLGLLMAITTVSALATRPIAGMVADRRGRHGVMVVGFFIMGVAVFLLPVIPLFSALLVIRFVQGIGWACSTTSTSTAASDIIPKKRFAEGMGYFSLSTAIALAIAPGLGIELLDTFGIAALSTVSIVCLALALVASFFISYKHISVESSNTKMELVERSSAFPSVIAFCLSLCYGAVITYLAIDAESKGIQGIALFFTVYALATLFSRPASGRLSDKKGFAPAVVFGIVFMVPSLVLIAMADSLAMYIAAALLLGIGYGTAQAALSAMAVILAPPERRGAANATYLLGLDAGIGVGSLASGALVGMIGCQDMFLATACMPVVAVAIYTIGHIAGLDKAK